MKCAYKNKRETELENKGFLKAAHLLVVALAQYLTDKRGWKSESVIAAVNWIYKFTIMLGENDLTLKEAEDVLHNEYGIVFSETGATLINKGDSR